MAFVFEVSESTPLCEIMGRHGSDKGSGDILNSWHNYTTLYHSLFKEIRRKPLRVFELGLGTNNVTLASNMGADGKPGASLREAYKAGKAPPVVLEATHESALQYIPKEALFSLKN